MKKIVILLFTIFLINSTYAQDSEKCEGIGYAADTLMTFYQMGSDVDKAKNIYTSLFKEDGEIFNQIVDEARSHPVYINEEEAEQAIENFKDKWKTYCLENNLS